MYPILIKLGPITIYSYGTLLAIGFLLAIFLARKRARIYGLSPDRITDLGLYTLIAGIIGARILYVLTQLNSFIHRPLLDIFKIWEGGLVYYGGLLVGIIVGAWYIKKIKYPFLQVADIIAPSISLGQSLGRMGCFLNGCCYGKVSKTYGIIFPNVDNFPHIPTQLIESIFTFAVFLFLIKREKHKKQAQQLRVYPQDGYPLGKAAHLPNRGQGEIFLLYLLLYSAGRFIIEIIRADDRGPSLFGIISVSQFVSILIFIISARILIKNKNEIKNR